MQNGETRLRLSNPIHKTKQLTNSGSLSLLTFRVKRSRQRTSKLSWESEPSAFDGVGQFLSSPGTSSISPPMHTPTMSTLLGRDWDELRTRICRVESACSCRIRRRRYHYKYLINLGHNSERLIDVIVIKIR